MNLLCDFKVKFSPLNLLQARKIGRATGRFFPHPRPQGRFPDRFGRFPDRFGLKIPKRFQRAQDRFWGRFLASKIRVLGPSGRFSRPRIAKRYSSNQVSRFLGFSTQFRFCFRRSDAILVSQKPSPGAGCFFPRALSKFKAEIPP